LPAELKSLLEVERAAGPMPAASRARVWEGLELGLAALPGVPLEPGPRMAARTARHALATHGLTALVGLVTGGGLGLAAGMHLAQKSQANPAPVIVPTSQPAPQLVAPEPLPTAPASALESKPAIGHRPPRLEQRVPAPAAVQAPSQKPNLIAAPKTAPATLSSPLDRERALIDTARTALGRGDANGALEFLDQHTREYPNGMLTEESEALRIETLLSAGGLQEARRAAAAFRVKHPKSLLLPAIEQSLEQQP
jgi:hypothetical protein